MARMIARPERSRKRLPGTVAAVETRDRYRAATNDGIAPKLRKILDQSGQVSAMGDEQFAKLMKEASTLPTTFLAGTAHYLGKLRRGELAKDAKPPAWLERFSQTSDLSENSLFRAAQWMREKGDETFPALPRLEDTLLIKVLDGVGQSIPSIAIGTLIGGPAGTVAGIADSFILSNGQTISKELAKGATDEDAARKGLIAAINARAASESAKALESGIKAGANALQGNEKVIAQVDKVLARIDKFVSKAPVPSQLKALKPIVMALTAQAVKKGMVPATIGAIEQFINNALDITTGVDEGKSLGDDVVKKAIGNLLPVPGNK